MNVTKEKTATGGTGKTLIVYATTHGCAESAAQTLSSLLDGEVTLVDLKKQSGLDLGAFSTIIVGGSIHAGQVQRRVKRFCQTNRQTLIQKRLGLYLCCMEEGEKAQQQFDMAFPADLREHAAASGLFGGEFDFAKMNFLQRAIVRKVAGIDRSVSKVKPENIRRFAAALNDR